MSVCVCTCVGVCVCVCVCLHVCMIHHRNADNEANNIRLHAYLIICMKYVILLCNAQLDLILTMVACPSCTVPHIYVHKNHATEAYSAWAASYHTA